MGWGDCGTDNAGRPIGYYVIATCDHDGCNQEISRGLANVCGGMHGEHHCLGGDGDRDWSAMYVSCEKYFCSKHLYFAVTEHEDGKEGPMPPALCYHCVIDYNRRYRTDAEMQDMWPTKATPLEIPLNYYQRNESTNDEYNT